MRGSEVSGFHTSYALGFALMGYIGAGYDVEDRRVFADLGFNLKIPVLKH